MPSRLLSLIADLQAIAPHLALDMRLLPSGVVFLNVYPGHRAFVLEYSPSQGFGVSELTPDTTPFDVGHEHIFDDAEPAASCLIGLVREATATPQSHAA